MATVELSEQEWQQVLSILSGAPWHVANPLLMKIGNQLRLQAPAQAAMQEGVPQGDGSEKRP